MDSNVTSQGRSPWLVRFWDERHKNRLYCFSKRDSSDCIWMQQLDPATKQPIGPAQDVYHLHTARLSVLAFPAFGFSVARDKAVLSLRELTGNIWMASPTTQK